MRDNRVIELKIPRGFGNSSSRLGSRMRGERMARRSSRNKVQTAPAITVPAVEGLLTRDEVAAILRVRRETLSRWLAQGRGPRAIVDGRLIRYRRADVERYIAGEREPT